MAWRAYKENKCCWVPQRLIFADTETTRQDHAWGQTLGWHTLKIVCASAGRLVGGRLMQRKTHSGSDGRAFWDWVASLLQKKERTWLWFHNWKFDCDVLEFRRLLESGEYTLATDGKDEFGLPDEHGRTKPFRGLWVDQGPPCIFSVLHHSGAPLLIVDSRNWFPERLETIGRWLGVPKLEVDFKTVSEGVLKKHCERDVEIVERLIVSLANWTRKLDLGQFRLTAASQAFSLWRHRCMTHKVVKHDIPQVARLERDGYFGGRTELFYVGQTRGDVREHVQQQMRIRRGQLLPPSGTIYELDGSSMYLSVMRSNLFPVKLHSWEISEGPDPLPPVKLDGGCIADVWLKNASIPFPCRVDGAVHWAKGSFRTTLAGPELARAVRAGFVTRCWRWARYHMEPAFTAYADEVWRLRAEAIRHGRTAENELLKKFGAALHGKFAQRDPAWVLDPEATSTIDWGFDKVRRCCAIGFPGVEDIPEHAEWSEARQTWEWWERVRVIGGHVYREVERADSETAFVAVAAFVAAYARERVREWIDTAGAWQTLAVHTDALLVTQDGFDNLVAAGQVRDRELGYLKLEHSSPDCIIRACGNYDLGEQIARAGIGRGAVPLPDGSYEVEQFQSLQDASFHPPGPGVLVSTVRKRIPSEYTKGVVRPDGWIEPHIKRQRQPAGGGEVIAR